MRYKKKTDFSVILYPILTNKSIFENKIKWTNFHAFGNYFLKLTGFVELDIKYFKRPPFWNVWWFFFYFKHNNTIWWDKLFEKSQRCKSKLLGVSIFFVFVKNTYRKTDGKLGTRDLCSYREMCLSWRKQ
jgi:hypothetical protein